MEKDSLYWKAFWTFFCGLGMVFCFTLLPFVVGFIGMQKLQGIHLLGFVGIAVPMLTVVAALISFLLVQLEGSNTNEALRVMRLQRLTNVGRICILFANPIGLVMVGALFLWEGVYVPLSEAIGLAQSNLGLEKDAPE
ncbi:MAG: hypothetical protein WC814_01185 [Candidatus Paceibacterota bacterium]|jgi:hypothetical protein